MLDSPWGNHQGFTACAWMQTLFVKSKWQEVKLLKANSRDIFGFVYDFKMRK